MPILLLFLAAIIAGGFFLVRKRFRRLWQEVLALRNSLQATNKQITSLRKDLFLTKLKHPLRLPARLPSEDGEEILLYQFFQQKTEGFYLEIGAYNGVDLSNTYFFEAIGWSGILIEPDPDLVRQCQRARPHSQVIHAAASDRRGTLTFTMARGKEWLSYSGEDEARSQRILAEGGTIERIEVACLTLNEILSHQDQPIDFISLDVEGHELSVLRGLDIDKTRPRVILIEQHKSDPNSEVSRLLSEHGYINRLHHGSNSFYTHQDDPGVFHW